MLTKSNQKQIKLPIVFMGTSELSEVILSALIENNYNIVGVFTKPDKKIGREQEITAPLVKKLAESHKIPVFQPKKFDFEAVEVLKKLKPDLVIVAAYGKIIPKAALEIPGFGFINVHVSLLPKYRGPSPIQNALLNGETQTGITIMLMDEGVDTGDILGQKIVEIAPSDNTETLTKKLSDTSAGFLLKIIPLLIERGLEPQKQDFSQASFCQLIEREDGHIYWSENAESIYNRYRALNPWPGIFSYWKNDSGIARLKLISISFQKINPTGKHEEGEVFEIGDDIGVQTSEGVVILKEIQKEGKKTMSAKEFINGYPNLIGTILE
jgi:methionyl-tRNA formyltransferase